MPYINKSTRSVLICGDRCPKTAGELNFYISSVIDQFLEEQGVDYTNLNEIIGVLECTKLELYRRVAAPYEDKKMKENGDVYTVSG